MSKSKNKRQLWWSCLRKRRYTKAKAGEKMTKRGSQTHRYHCTNCGMWHLAIRGKKGAGDE